MRKLFVLACVFALTAAPLAARQEFIQGVFTSTESGTPLELIAWAEPMGNGSLKLTQGFLEDAPILLAAGSPEQQDAAAFRGQAERPDH